MGCGSSVEPTVKLQKSSTATPQGITTPSAGSLRSKVTIAPTEGDLPLTSARGSISRHSLGPPSPSMSVEEEALFAALKRKESACELAEEPSAIVATARRQLRVLKARYYFGITGDPDQYNDGIESSEMDPKLQTFIFEWLIETGNALGGEEFEPIASTNYPSMNSVTSAAQSLDELMMMSIEQDVGSVGTPTNGSVICSPGSPNLTDLGLLGTPQVSMVDFALTSELAAANELVPALGGA